MKHFILIIIVLSTSQLHAQDVLYSSTTTLRHDTTMVLSNSNQDQLTYLKYNLNKYYKERQLGYSFIGTGLILGGAGYAMIESGNDKNGKYFLYGSLVCDIVAAICFYDAEKWLKNGAVTIDLTGVKISF